MIIKFHLTSVPFEALGSEVDDFYVAGFWGFLDKPFLWRVVLDKVIVAQIDLGVQELTESISECLVDATQSPQCLFVGRLLVP